VVDAVIGGANASSRVVCGELDGDAESCRLTGALIAGALTAGALLAGGGGETTAEGVVPGCGGTVAIVPGLGGTVAIGLKGTAAIVLRLWETAAITDLPSASWPAICTTTPLALAIDPQTSAAEAAANGRDWCMMPPNPTALSRPTPVKAPIIGRAGSGKVQWGQHRGPIGAAGPRPRAGCRRSDYRRSAGAAKRRLGGARLHTWRVWNTWRVWRLREDFSRSERASRYQSTLFGRRAAQQRGAIAAALHGADGALRLLERRAQGLSRGG
jgi:hypothetical protein